MKWLVVIILTPIYVLFKIYKKTFELLERIGQTIADEYAQPLIDMLRKFFIRMYIFWFKEKDKTRLTIKLDAIECENEDNKIKVIIKEDGIYGINTITGEKVYSLKNNEN